jgi:5-formyltetrahydrofolate cyclo-ligase
MWDVQMGEKKPALRAAALSQRNSLSPAQALALSRLIQAKALQFSRYLQALSVALYSPIQNEVGTEEIRERSLAQAKILFYPRLGRGNGVELVEVKSAGELKPGPFGILEPAGRTILSDREIGGLIVFVPGVAFDLRGNRLGRGRGWYDRLLGRLGARATSVGLTYEFQIIGEVPVDSWDQRVQFLITESRIIDCAVSHPQSPLLA